MSSLAGKMSLLVDEYNHSKTSPAYRKLSIKYKALKKSNQELIRLLTSLFSGNSNDDIRRVSRRSQTHADRTDTDQHNIIEETQSDEDIEAIFVPYDLPQNNTDDVEEEEERDLESCNADEDDEEEEEGEADCEEEDETEDPDIKEQIIQEQVAESFAVKEEEPQEKEPQEKEPQTVAVEEDETDEIVEYEEVEETEEVVEEEETDEIVEYEEVEETEEVEYEEVEETEEVEVVEEEEEEAGVYEIEVNGTRYYTTNEKDGIVYSLLEDDDVGDEVGKFVNGKLVLN